MYNVQMNQGWGINLSKQREILIHVLYLKIHSKVNFACIKQGSGRVTMGTKPLIKP